MTAGTNAANQMISTFAASPRPSQTIASGIHASGGMGRISRNAGLTNASNDRLQPIARPSGTPTIDRGGEAEQHELHAVQHVLVQPRVGVAGDDDLAQRVPRLSRCGEAARADRLRQRGERVPRREQHDERRDADPARSPTLAARGGPSPLMAGARDHESRGASVGAVRERLQLRIGVDHAAGIRR